MEQEEIQKNYKSFVGFDCLFCREYYRFQAFKENAGRFDNKIS